MKPQLPPKLFSPPHAAAYLGLAQSTLNNSRYTGLLGGVKAPRYLKLGKAIRYTQASLDDWLGQFDEQTSTAQNAK